MESLACIFFTVVDIFFLAVKDVRLNLFLINTPTREVAVFLIHDVLPEVRVDVDGDTTFNYSPNFDFGTRLC